MATISARINMRRGSKTSFEQTKNQLVAGEFGVTTDSPNRDVYISYGGGDVKHIIDESDVATQTDVGVVKVDGSTINVNGYGEISTPAYMKPDTGVPKSHLSASVQESLNKADSAIQDISMKQDKTDTSLETESTTIVGAINEVRSNLIQEGQTRSSTDELLQQDLDTKVTKVAAQTGNPFVYGRMNSEAGGTEGKFTLSDTVVSGCVVKRNGNQIKGVTPVSDNDVAVKSYVDTGDSTASTKVKQDLTSNNYEAPILFKANAQTTTATGQIFFDEVVRINPSTGNVTATTFTEGEDKLEDKYAQITYVETQIATKQNTLPNTTGGFKSLKVTDGVIEYGDAEINVATEQEIIEYLDIPVD